MEKNTEQNVKALADLEGLLYSACIGTDGSSIPIDMSGIPSYRPDEHYYWLHMCASHDDTRAYLEQHTKLDNLVIDALLAEDTRPRTLGRPEGTLLVLRAMNFLPGGKPEDMISLRLWVEPGMVLTTRLRDAKAIEDLKSMMADNDAPNRVGKFVTAITDRVYSRMEPVLDDLEDCTAILEEQIAKKEIERASDNTSPLRIKATILRRHIVPQHAALANLIRLKPIWLKDEDVEQLLESEDQITRYVENLNDVRDRLIILNDEISRQNDERMSSTNYLFALAATIFLPLTFITGLLGVNIAGIPGTENESAFPILILLCVVAVAIQVAIFRKKGWF